MLIGSDNISLPQAFSLREKVALVTGGAGKYGRFIAEALAEMGATVVLASRNLSACREWARELESKGGRVFAYQLDLANEDCIRKLIDQVQTDHGYLNILVNNAVLRPITGGAFDGDKWEKSLQVNASNLFLITQLAAEVMKADGGSIINIASIQGMLGPYLPLYQGLNMEPVADYFFHKAGMLNMTRYFASLYGQYNIRVNSISPGGLLNQQDEEFIWRYSERTMLKRLASGADIKGAIAFLASDASRYVTGTNLVIDGGYSAC